MKVIDIINNETEERNFSFEVLPPLKGTGTANLFDTIDRLRQFGPRFINITTHHSEYVYKELDNGQFERQRIRRRPGTIAIAAAIHHGVPIHEYAPMKIKMAITGNGNAAKEQVAGMLQRMLKIPQKEMSKFMDATDALAAAYCHYLQMGRPVSDVKYRGWKDFVNKNKEKVSKRPSINPESKKDEDN